jgi:FAD/FMN-containing dehydrogenase
MHAAGTSWGRLRHSSQRIVALSSRFDRSWPAGPLLPYGNGRSYGDVCLNDGGTLLATRGLDRFVSFDPLTGIVECEAGVLLNHLIELVLPSGWFPAVTPGTSLVSIGGAIANDVHGKNHHRAGSFGNHVLEFDLRRSDGRLLRCCPDENPDWFDATIGGLGLTGLIEKATLQLRRIPGPWIQGDSRRFAHLREFFSLARDSDVRYEYTVAWLDCSARGPQMGRGIFMRGNHVSETRSAPSATRLRIPFTPPFSLVNSLSLRLFNWLYFHRARAQAADALWHFRPFFYPLDGIGDWNRMYGPAGFFQYQCVIPEVDAEGALTEMIRRIGREGTGSFLAVLKLFGAVPSRGMLSFSRPGATLALDFPNRGDRTLSLLESLDEITRGAGGAVYPAKDARMSPASFRAYFPAWERFRAFVDPQFSSSFWRRVTAEPK